MLDLGLRTGPRSASLSLGDHAMGLEAAGTPRSGARVPVVGKAVVAACLQLRRPKLLAAMGLFFRPFGER